jgi:7-cyano-7-deazaguanine synthase
MTTNDDLHAVSVVSGGLDSTVMAYWLAWNGYDQTMLTFNYGQRHCKEIDYAKRTAATLRIDHHVVNLTAVTKFLHASALVNRDAPVPDGHYEDAMMRQTVVPNRNAMMLTIATTAAVALNASVVATAVHAGDHAVYPDCRPEFIHAFGAAMLAANDGFLHKNFAVFAPFVHMDKADIVAVGYELDVPFVDTWSYYRGDEHHCGTCGTCVERREAFHLVDVPDPTLYTDATTEA